MIGEKLIVLRKKQGLSQQEVADILDVTRQTVSNWECEQGAPTIDKALRLAQLYHVSLDDLVGNDVEFITNKPKELSPILMRMIGKTCQIQCEEVVNFEVPYKILDINEDWVKVEYERVKEDALLKKETVIKYIDLATISGFCIVKEGK